NNVSNVFYFSLLVFLFFSFSSCKKNVKWLDVDPAYAKYIDAYTTGMISKTSTVRIQLAADAATTHTIGQPVKEPLFEFTPAVKGTAVWLDATTIEFKPSNNLLPDQLYEVNFKLGAVTRVASEYRNFKFSVQTTKPAF